MGKQNKSLQICFSSPPSQMSLEAQVRKIIVTATKLNVQGHGHYGDQAARRPHILCSISDRSFGDLAKAARLFMASHHKPKQRNLKCTLLSCSPISYSLAEMKERDFSTPTSGIGPFDSPPIVTCISQFLPCRRKRFWGQLNNSKG